MLIFLPWVLISMFFMTTPPSVPKVGFAMCRPVAVHGGDGLFVVFAVDDGIQSLLTSCGFCVVFGRRERLRVQIRLGAGVLGVHGVHVILRLGTDTHAAAVLAVKAGVKFQFPLYQIDAGGFDLPQAGDGGDFLLPLLLCADTGFALLQQHGHDLRLCGFNSGKSRFVCAVHNQISGWLAVFVDFKGNFVSQNQFLCVHVLFLLLPRVLFRTSGQGCAGIPPAPTRHQCHKLQDLREDPQTSAEQGGGFRRRSRGTPTKHQGRRGRYRRSPPSRRCPRWCRIFPASCRTICGCPLQISMRIRCTRQFSCPVPPVKNVHGARSSGSAPPEAVMLSGDQLCGRSGHAILGGADAVRLAVGVGHRVVPVIVGGEGVRRGLAVKPRLPAEAGSPYCVGDGIKSLFHNVSPSAAVRLPFLDLSIYYHAMRGMSRENRNFNQKNIPHRFGTGYFFSRYSPSSLPQVPFPAIPSAPRPYLVWNFFSAVSVPLPKSPSAPATPQEKP
nr:MAG TPA: hypothetical protein [Caudoviricetes sp.]